MIFWGDWSCCRVEAVHCDHRNQASHQGREDGENGIRMEISFWATLTWLQETFPGCHFCLPSVDFSSYSFLELARTTLKSSHYRFHKLCSYRNTSSSFKNRIMPPFCLIKCHSCLGWRSLISLGWEWSCVTLAQVRFPVGFCDWSF